MARALPGADGRESGRFRLFGWVRAAEVVEQMKGERWQHPVDRRGEWARDLVLSLARQPAAVGGLTLGELGKKMRMDRYSAVSKAIVRFQGLFWGHISAIFN